MANGAKHQMSATNEIIKRQYGVCLIAVCRQPQAPGMACIVRLRSQPIAASNISSKVIMKIFNIINQWRRRKSIISIASAWPARNKWKYFNRNESKQSIMNINRRGGHRVAAISWKANISVAALDMRGMAYQAKKRNHSSSLLSSASNGSSAQWRSNGAAAIF